MKELISALATEFGERKGFGVTGFALDTITKFLNDRIPNNEVRINVPYYEFNVRGKVSEVHREVHGVMPMTYLSKHYDEVVKEGETTTFFYGNRLANEIGTYLPFLSECDVYFISESKEENGVLVISLKKGPSWRMYL